MISSFLRMKSLFPSKGSLFLHLLAGKARKECWQHYVKKGFWIFKRMRNSLHALPKIDLNVLRPSTHTLAVEVEKKFSPRKNLSVNWKLPLQNFYSKLCASESKKNSFWASSYPKWREVCRYEGQQHLVSTKLQKIGPDSMETALT